MIASALTGYATGTAVDIYGLGTCGTWPRAAEAHESDSSDEPAQQTASDVLTAASGPGSASLPSGEGIGLSIVKRLCEVLGATVELETAPGHGTTIRIIFPARYSSPAQDQSPL